jgi:hypothetical protein
MKQYNLIFSLFFLLVSQISIAQEKSNQKSRVISFHYTGYGDNLYAPFQGSVFFTNPIFKAKDSIKPLTKARITAIDSLGKVFKIVLTDKNGKFNIDFPYGKYIIKIEKTGFQTLIVNNYFAIGDQVSFLDVILEKGIGIQKYRIEDWKEP